MAAILSSVICIFMISSLILLLGLPNNNNNISIPRGHNYNINQINYHHMELILTWVPTFCKMKQCLPSAPIDFTLHGLWPADNAGVSLTYCPPPSPPIDLTPLFNTLRADLELIWPTVTPFMSSQDLWEHEYKKHGLCAFPLLSAQQYFRSAIQMTGNMDLLHFFSNKNILPSDHTAYTRTQITGAAREAMGNQRFDIYISCKHFNRTHDKLYEIHLCLDQMVTNYMTCPQSPLFRGCSPGKLILLPPSM
ncbi:hypothetical protein RD792_005987 [Penstemon davidsonii]|uniref:Uncharacterized protein n=1 Tax=Penstemon davidsonii TaxID=160366 RepID=A0ABR0DDS8_9LAMI|nr:hypothetical protein RD792_005987 [Penstemon davidsonii]